MSEPGTTVQPARNVVSTMASRSVVFDFNGTTGFRIDNRAPYALRGDRNGDYNSVVFPVGQNSVMATPFSRPGGNGDVGEALMVNFEVIDTSDTLDSTVDKGSVYPNPVQNVTQFTLEGASRQLLKGTLLNIMGQVVNDSFDFEVDDFGSAPLDLTNLPQGIYILKLRDTSGKMVSEVKLIKE